VVGSCEHGNEPSSSIKVVEFLDQLSDSFSEMTLLLGISGIAFHSINFVVMKSFCLNIPLKYETSRQSGFVFRRCQFRFSVPIEGFMPFLRPSRA
jgi:hypothetical protein